MNAEDRQRWNRIRNLHARGASITRMTQGTGVRRGTVIRLLELKRKEAADMEQRLNRDGVQHGGTCQKVPHVGAGHMHGEDDDTPFKVDGCLYCGRCHTAL